MLCQECKQRPATVRMTKIVNGQKSEAHYCDTCAREKGQLEFGIDPGFNIQNLLSSLLNQEQLLKGNGPPVSEPRCPVCGITYSNFANTGFLGCGHCYEHFDTQLAPFIRRIHGSTQHTGKAPKRTGGLVRLRRELAQLKEDLQRLVAAEEFERAAELRDKIKELERKVKGGGEVGAVE